MRLALLFVTALAAVAPVGARAAIPPKVDARAPVWLDDHLVGFDYIGTLGAPRLRYAARDDGSGLMPLSGPTPGRLQLGCGRALVTVDPVSRLLFFNGSRVGPGAVAGLVACDPDSTLVAFVHDRAVWTVWTDGTHLRRLHAGVAVDWLLEHVLAVASGGRSGVVWAVRDDGTTLRVVVTGGRRRGRNRCLTPRRGDRLRAIQAQWGDDVIFSASGADTVDGGSGDDIIRTGAGGDFIKPGPGRDVVDAGTGDDHVVANDGERDVVDCGPGDDRARVDTLDVVRNCEHVTIASP